VYPQLTLRCAFGHCFRFQWLLDHAQDALWRDARF
jgi:hypothetical protein